MLPFETSPGNTVTDLASLVAPYSETQFIDCFLEKRRLLVKTSTPMRADSLLPAWALDRLIASGTLQADRLHVLRDGEVVEKGRFRDEGGRVRSGALERLIAEGVSFVVSGIDDDVPAIASLSDALERRLGHRVWVNTYVTHGPGGALPPHYDDHDVLVLQLRGKKRWFGHGTPKPSPIGPSSEGEVFGPPQWDALLEPGDVLYVTRGEVHHASVEGPSSVHLTFAIDTRRGVDFLESLVERAKLDPAFREDLTRLGGVSRLCDQERKLKDRLHALIEQADLETYLTADAAERPPRSADGSRSR